jgi:hypothetical protein
MTDYTYTVARLISEIRGYVPSLRIGQILVNACGMPGAGGDPFYVEDEDLVAGLEEFRDLCMKQDDARRNGSKPARLDADRTAKPLTELVRRIAPEDMGKCQDMSQANTYRRRKEDK